MLTIKDELSYLNNFFKIFGLYLGDIKSSTSKCNKLLNFWPYGVFIIHILKMSQMIIIEIYNWTQMTEKIFWERYPGIIMKNSACVAGFLSIIMIYTNQKHEQKFWELINHLDDFLVRFLDIRINHKKENREHIGRTILFIFVAFSVGTILSEAGFSPTDNYRRFYSSAFYFLILKQLHVHRYIFYVTVLSNRIKILSENCDKITQSDYKLRTVPRVYLILWKLTQKIEKIFGWTMVAIASEFVVISLFFGFLLSVDLAVNSANIAHIFSLVVPQFIIWHMCFVCNRVKCYVSSVLVLF